MKDKRLYPTQEEEDEILEHLRSCGRPFKKMPEKLTNQVLEFDKQKEKRFTYDGPPAQRRFCKEIQGMNKEWLKSEIDMMSFQGRNRKMGHKGRPYSIWKYKGSVNCAHAWREWIIMEDNQGREYRVNNGMATGKAGEFANASNHYWKHPSRW